VYLSTRYVRYEGVKFSQLRAAHCDIPAMQRCPSIAIRSEYFSAKAILLQNEEESRVDQINPYYGHRHCNTRPRRIGIRGELRRIVQ
jgi:hypothetical protein